MTTKRRLIEEAERVNPVVPVHVWRSPADAAVDVVIVTALSVYAAVHEQAVAALPNETGGFLVGRVGFDARDESWHLAIEEAVPVTPSEQHPTYFQFTWRDVDRVRTYREQHRKALLGWYHTHPDFGVFLSDTDLDKTHRVLFSEPFQIALVYDPVRSRAGYFFWEGAQYIDPGQAEWREFDIAFTDVPEDVAQPETSTGTEAAAETDAQPITQAAAVQEEPEPVEVEPTEPEREAKSDPQPEPEARLEPQVRAAASGEGQGT